MHACALTHAGGLKSFNLLPANQDFHITQTLPITANAEVFQNIPSRWLVVNSLSPRSAPQTDRFIQVKMRQFGRKSQHCRGRQLRDSDQVVFD